VDTNRRLAAAHAVLAQVEHDHASSWGALCAAFGKPAVETAKKHGLIEAVLPGFYVARDRSADFRVRAATLTAWATPSGAITGLAAAHLWHLIDAPPPRITLQVPPGWHREPPPWARLLRTDSVAQRYRLGAVRVVSPADAVVQVWCEARHDVGASAVIAAVMEGRATVAEVRAALARRKRVARRGELTQLLDLVGTTVTSYLEYVAWKRVFPPHLFPELQWQETVSANGRKRIMDACNPDAKIDLEFDGGSTHGGVEGFERDRARDRDLRSLGYEPLHFTYRDLTERPEWCRRMYRELRAKRLREQRAA